MTESLSSGQGTTPAQASSPACAPPGAIHPGKPFGALECPDSLQVLNIDRPAGQLTAIRGIPSGVPTKGVALLVPGFTGSKEDFYDIVPLLARLGWDTWAISQRGQADSMAPKGIEAYAKEHTAADVIAVGRIIASACGVERVHLLGHSFGGTVAQAAVISDASPFASLTLLCSGPHGWPGRHDRDREMLHDHPGVDLWRLNNPDQADAPDDQLRSELFFRQRAERTSTDQLLAAVDQLADVYDTTFELADTHTPVMVCHGEDDPAWPQDWQRRMARILHAEYAVIPHAAHCPNIENPTYTATLLDGFWSNVRSNKQPTGV